VRLHGTAWPAIPAFSSGEGPRKLKFLDTVELRRGIRYAPLVFLALSIYAGLPSRFVFPDDFEMVRLADSWLPAFVNVGDLLLVLAIAITWAVYKPRLNGGTGLFLCATLAIVLLSLIVGSPQPDIGSMFDGLLDWLRFAATFAFAVWLTRQCGPRTAEALLIVLFVILCITALGVYSLQFGRFNRIYASAMTVASFGQVAAVVLFVALVRRYYLLLALGVTFLVLTFSVTSIILFLGIAFMYVVTSRLLSLRQRIAMLSAVTIIISVALVATVVSGQFGSIYSYIVSSSDQTSSLSALHGRTPVWAYGLDLIRSGSVGPLGVGYNRSPMFLHQVTFALVEAGIADPGTYTVPHFHSILFEWALGLGLPSVLIFFVLVRRIAQMWLWKCQPAAMIFAFFLLAQSVDFTFYEPKEVVLWALMLGIAEGEWQLARVYHPASPRARYAPSGATTRSILATQPPSLKERGT
jgi:hypothetical protein